MTLINMAAGRRVGMVRTKLGKSLLCRRVRVRDVAAAAAAGPRHMRRPPRAPSSDAVCCSSSGMIGAALPLDNVGGPTIDIANEDTPPIPKTQQKQNTHLFTHLFECVLDISPYIYVKVFPVLAHRPCQEVHVSPGPRAQAKQRLLISDIT